MKINKFLTPVLSLPLVVCFGLSAMVSCSKDKKTAFETDPWSTIVEHANQGLNHLKQHYGVNSFVGLERSVKINGLDQKVRVIGENEDYIASASGAPTNDMAALTFQFVNVLSWLSVNQILPVCVSMGASTWGWENSDVRTYLTSTVGENSFANQMNEQLGVGAVQTVSKWSVNHDLDDPASAHSETFFIPSLADIYNEDQINFDIFEDADFYQLEANHLVGSEEYQKPYSYYRNNINQDDDFAYEHTTRVLALTDCDGYSQPYWLRTTYEDFDKDNNAHYCIWTNGRRCIDETITLEGEIFDGFNLCLSPVFCIGISEA